MNDLTVLYSEIRQDMQGMKKSLAKIADGHSKRLMEEWVRRDEAARILGISTRTVSRLTYSGKLPYSKVNGTVYIKTKDIERLLTENFNQSVSLNH